MCECFEEYERGNFGALGVSCLIRVIWRITSAREAKRVDFHCPHGDAFSMIIVPGHPLWRWAAQFPTTQEQGASVFDFGLAPNAVPRAI